MARYVDGFLLPFRRTWTYPHVGKAGKVWREHGALEYRECVGDDLKVKVGLAFRQRSSASRGRRWSFPGLSSPARIAIASTRR